MLLKKYIFGAKRKIVQGSFPENLEYSREIKDVLVPVCTWEFLNGGRGEHTVNSPNSGHFDRQTSLITGQIHIPYSKPYKNFMKGGHF